MKKVTNVIFMLIKAWRKRMEGRQKMISVPQGIIGTNRGVNRSLEELSEVSEVPQAKQTSQMLEDPQVRGKEPVRSTKKEEVVCLTKRVNSFLKSNYDFRYNQLTEETEFRPLHGEKRIFRPVNKRELNTLCMEAHIQGILCWDKDISRYIYSTQIAEYHPFRLYMEELPLWDGMDRITPLALRVSNQPLWVRGFHTWLLGLAAQWAGHTGIQANSVAPILVSSEQGRLKSTFCKSLMPEALQHYYMDNLKLTSEGKAERLMAEMGLINLDEFDKYPAGKMPMLKNLMQMSSLHICKAYQKNYCDLPRIASFIGTSNRYDLMSDPTGSRRFLCVEVQKPIDCEGIDHAQIFAQLRAELEQGTPYWFDKELERELQQHNASFYRACPAEDVFHCYFRSALPDEEGLHLSAADIYKELKQRNAAALKGANPNQLAQVLMKVGVRRKHTEYGNVYLVVRR